LPSPGGTQRDRRGGQAMSWLVAVPVVLPLIGTGLTLVLARRPKAQAVVSLTVLSLVLTAAVALLVRVEDGAVVMDVGGCAVPGGLALGAHRLRALRLVMSVAVTRVVLVCCLARGLPDRARAAPLAICLPPVLRLSA